MSRHAGPPAGQAGQRDAQATPGGSGRHDGERGLEWRTAHLPGVGDGQAQLLRPEVERLLDPPHLRFLAD